VFTTMKAVKRGASVVSTQKHRKPKKARKEAQSQLMDDAIDAACSQDESFNSSSSNECDCKAVITSLKKEVAELKAQVDFLLNFFNLKEVNILSDESDQGQSTKSSQRTAASNSAENSTISTAPIAVQSRPKPAQVLSAPLRQAVLSAVYGDLSAKNNRSTNVVISGVAPESTRADKDIVVDLIARELHIQPTVRGCKRLGKPTPDRIQLLCATLSSTVEVDQVLGSAKFLRSSTQQYIRDRVFISRDLTRAEAQAAYENRCRLRARRAAATASLPSTSMPSINVNVRGDHDQHHSVLIMSGDAATTTVNPVLPTTSPSFPMNPVAPVFQPSV